MKNFYQKFNSKLELFKFKRLFLLLLQVLPNFFNFSVNILRNILLILKNSPFSPFLKILKLFYRITLVCNGLLFLGVILDYNEIIIPSISFNNIFNLYFKYINDIKDLIFNKTFNILNPMEETKIPSPENNLSNEVTNTSNDTTTKNTSVIETNKPKPPFYTSPYFYIPLIASGLILGYLGSDQIISVLSSLLDLFSGSGGRGGPVNPDWTPPTYPLYDPYPEVEREMARLGLLDD